MHVFHTIRQDSATQVNIGGNHRKEAGGGLLMYVKAHLAPFTERREQCTFCK